MWSQPIALRLVLLFILLLIPVLSVSATERWVLVDTAKKTVAVYDGENTVRTFEGAAIGRGGTSTVRSRGDNTTPLGEFRIHWINEESQFHIFLGLDFPDFEHTRKAYANGKLGIDQFLQVTDSLRSNRVPPQTTDLGGHIGIHGVGKADADVHAVSDWTRGCVALTDSQIEDLLEMVEIGTRVVVQ
ncbi:L,D-transpeptidase [Methylonatrum kenyense]|uniref:L,D-transpeptidase n=1 Tax=Methylonatrum kenyense TaxID=455253 RepID=UPI0020BEE4AF|nr:L,D-transpeptidase [Methylonatrum kenyense]MCK8516430.1 L,D-transpeptidase [Methylonatrum kenyense]